MTEQSTKNSFNSLNHQDLDTLGAFDRWNLESVEVLEDLLRALRRKKGFGLFFVQCSPAQGQQVIEAIEKRLPQKRLTQVELNRESETLYGELLERSQTESFEIVCITGIEQALYGYEDTKRIAGWTSEEIYNYSWKGLPPLLGHLNRQREAFEANLPVSLIFFAPSFVIDYFVQRAPDFFDWRSGFFKIAKNSDDLQNASQELVGRKYKEYLDLSSEQRIEKILEIKDKILNLNSSDCAEKSNLLREQGRLFQSGKDLQRALDCYDRAILTKYENFKAWNSKGNVLHDTARYEEAIESYDKAIAITSTCHDSWRQRGHVLRDLGKHEEALESYDQAIKIEPSDLQAWNSKGNVLVDLGKHKEAIENFDHALKVEEADFIWFNRGYALECLYLFQDALSNYEKALNPGENDHFVWTRIGIVKHILCRYEEAIENYDLALKFRNDYYPAWVNRANALGGLKRYSDALLNINRALNIRPESYRAWRCQALILEQLGRYQEALNSYKRIGKLNPHGFFGWYHQAYGLYYSNEYELAIESFRTAIRSLGEGTCNWYMGFSGITIRFESDPSYMAFYGLGVSFLKFGQYRNALDGFQKCILSLSLYKDALKALCITIVSIFRGKFKYEGLNEAIYWLVRNLGLRR